MMIIKLKGGKEKRWNMNLKKETELEDIKTDV